MDEVEELKEQLKVKMDSENQMREVVAEYERTISELISDKEKEKSEMEVEGNNYLDVESIESLYRLMCPK